MIYKNILKDILVFKKFKGGRGSGGNPGGDGDPKYVKMGGNRLKVLPKICQVLVDYFDYLHHLRLLQ